VNEPSGRWKTKKQDKKRKIYTIQRGNNNLVERYFTRGRREKSPEVLLFNQLGRSKLEW
jgi:hypothetical protein